MHGASSDERAPRSVDPTIAERATCRGCEAIIRSASSPACSKKARGRTTGAAEYSSTAVAREDEIVVAGMRLVTGEAGLVLRLVGRLAVDEAAKAPAACRGVSLRILDHD